MPKEAQRATVQPFILAMQVYSLAVMAAQGGLGPEVTELVVRAVPALGVGIGVGLILFGRVPDAGFRRVVLLLLLECALLLLKLWQSTEEDTGKKFTRLSFSEIT